jgi:hypothetical protein
MIKQLETAGLFLIRFIIQIIKSGLNERNILTLPLNFFINFSPVMLWLATFKNAGIIPHEIRPKIHVRLAHDWDLIMFGNSWFPFWVLISACFTFVWIKLVKKFSLKYNNPLDLALAQSADDLENTQIELYQFFESSEATVDKVFDDDESSSRSSDSEDSTFSSSSGSETASSVIPINIKKISRTTQLYAIPVLFFLIWPVLNMDEHFAHSISKTTDLIAWFFYVLGHITFPILTAVWLYVFHQQGALRCFSIALGTQNMMGVLTHLTFPNAPPWFIHMYGLDADANYDMPGYAAGLTRVDTVLGTHMHSNGFHKSPIVFGAFPSLHSAMAFQVCLFILYYACSNVLKFAAVGFVVIQWWATIHLDHHFRLDLIGGVLYALVAFALVYPFILRVEKSFMSARLLGDFKKGSSMGMRVFKKNKRVQKFFDPYR